MNNKSQVEYMLDNVRKMITNVIVKSSYLADKYETAESSREADRYIAASMQRDTFNSYRTYPTDVLVNAGITDIKEIMACTEDRSKIPRNKRQEVLKYMRETVIKEYVEMNDYYRELIGMPSVDTPESEYIYLTQVEMDYYKIDEVRPIHDYPLEVLIKLERIVIPNLIKQYPEKTYLQHMGSKAVNIIRAREAKNFDIIYTDIVLDHVFMRAFFETYNFCREYFMSMIYNKQFKTRYDLYDNYIGMHIMIMTVQRLIVDMVKMGIERDFYDLTTIQKMFNVYGIPFFEDLPLDYQRTIVKNINKLVRSKSTDKVLYDIANTLFYERVNINKFYLVKERKFDENGEPIVLYKNVAIEGDPDKIYIKDGNRIYQLAVQDDRLCVIDYTNPTEVKTVNELYFKDEVNHLKYKLFIKNTQLYTEETSDNVEYTENVYVYDEQNKRYEVTMTDGILTTMEKQYDHIDDYSYVSTVKVIIRSSNNYNYELAIQGDRLITHRIYNDSVHAPKAIYIKDEMTGEKFKLFMNDDVLCAEETFDTDIACQSLFLYDENQNRYKLTVNKNKIQTSDYYYTTIEVYDYEKMYDFYFQSTDILEKNPITMIENKYNRYEYDEIVKEDVYWWETEELKKELHERDYNYIDTKYIGITIMQNLTNILYDTSYFLNLLVDHKNTTVPFEQRIFNSDAMKTGTDYLFVDINRFSTTPVSVFDAVIILCALVSKKNGMKGNIIVKNPAQILSVLGFNFDLNFDLIRANIKKYKRTFKNQEIVKYLDLLDIKTVGDINTLYSNFRNFAEFCENVIATTNDIDEYRAYKELYKVFTVRKDTTEAFTMSTGEVANTYMDYLRDKLPYIAETIDGIHKDDTGVYIEHVLGKLNELVPHIEYLNTLNGSNNNIVDAIVGLINFFKSYTVDLRNLNIVYMFDNKRMNKIFMIDDPRLFIRLFPEEQILGYNDEIRYMIDFDRNDNLIIYTGKKMLNEIIPKDEMMLDNKLDMIINNMTVEDVVNLDYKDTIEVSNKLNNNDIIHLKTVNGLSNIIIPKNWFNTEDILKLYNILHAIETMEFNYKDIMELRSNLDLYNNIELKQIVGLSNILVGKSTIPNLHDTLTLCIVLNVLDSIELNYKDIIVKMTAGCTIEEKIKLFAKQALSVILSNNEYSLILQDKAVMSILLDLFDSLEIDYKDVIERAVISFDKNDGYNIRDWDYFLIKISESDQQIIYDKSCSESRIYSNDAINMDYKDIVSNISYTNEYTDNLILRILHYHIAKINSNESLIIKETVKLIHED